MSTLFNDGLAIIYSYLNCTEWNAASRTCHHWFAIAGSPSMKMHALIQRKHTAAHFLRPASTSSQIKHPPSPSPWSLRHRLTSLHLTECTLDHLLLLSQLTPHLRSLQIDSVIDTQPTMRFLDSKKDQSLTFPESLTSISILGDPAGAYLPTQFMYVFGFALSSSSLGSLQLTHLHLSIFPSFDISALTTNPSLQQSLQRLHIVFPMRSHAMDLQLMRDVSHLSSLTQLQFDHISIYHSNLANMQVMPSLTELFIPNLGISSQSLIHLHSRTPNIERLRGNTNGGSYLKDASEYSRFKHLKEITIGPWGSITTESKFVVSLCSSASQPPIECLRFDKCIFAESESWSRLSDAFPSLTQLELVNLFAQRTDPLIPILSLSQLTSRLRSITCHKCTLTSRLFDSHASLPNLTYLSLQLIVRSALRPQQIFDHVNQPQFMPQLIFLEIEILGRMFLLVDTEKGVEKCDFHGDSMKLDKRRLPQPKLPLPADVTPAPRLVGIELNPGPHASPPSSLTEVVTSATIFDDGLHLIYSYLLTSEWNAAARVSRHWFHLASISRPRLIHFEVHPVDTKQISRLERNQPVIITESPTSSSIVEETPSPRLVGVELNPGPMATLFNDGLVMIYSYLMTRDWNSAALISRHWLTVARDSGRTDAIRFVSMYSRQLESFLHAKFSASTQAATASLRHRITHIDIKVYPLDQLHLLVPLLPHVQEVRIMKIGPAASNSQWKADANSIPKVSFPSSLTSFTLGDSIPSKSSNFSQYVIDWLAECVTSKEGHEQCSLTSLSLSRVPIILRLFRLFDLPSLRASLISLELTFDTMGTDAETSLNASARTMTLCSQFSRLTTLRFDGLYLNHDSLTYMSVMPSLTELIASSLRIDSDSLTLLHTQTPALERLRSDESDRSASTPISYSGFTRLKEISFAASTFFYDPSILDTFCTSCSHLPLETIRFLRRASDSVSTESWSRLATTFLSLSHLIFEQLDSADDLFSSLFSVPQFCSRITSIDCQQSIGAFDSLFTEEASSLLTNLRHLTLIQSQSSQPMSPRAIYDQCNQMNFFPRLMYLKIVHEGIVIEYDQVKRINRCLFGGKQLQIRVDNQSNENISNDNKSLH